MLHAKHDLNSSVIPLLPLFIYIVRYFSRAILGISCSPSSVLLIYPSCLEAPEQQMAWHHPGSPVSACYFGLPRQALSPE